MFFCFIFFLLLCNNQNLSTCANKSIKLEPYDVTTMYAYAQGGSHQVGPPHYASPPTYHMSPHMTSHHQLAASMPLATSLGAAAGMPTVEQHHLQNDHMSHHTPMHHMEPQLTELASQTKRRRYVILFTEQGYDLTTCHFWFFGYLQLSLKNPTKQVISLRLRLFEKFISTRCSRNN